MPACTVLIAARDLLDLLRSELPPAAEVLQFADTEPLRALETIAERRPSIVAVEQLFAASPRGAALINRIKADPALASSRILVLSAGGGASRTVHRPEPVAPIAPEDQRGTRRAPRVIVRLGIEILVDGNAAGLVNLSKLGAQVVSSVALKPNSRVRMMLADGDQAARLAGSVVWARFEIPHEDGNPAYRAGIEFLAGDTETVDVFCERWRV